jgi:ubiquinone/menaquinone biosynthesis C-methylase UbiE
MSDQLTHIDNEQAAAMAFNKQAVVFDALYEGDLIIQYKRNRVRQHVMQWLAPNSSILELNAGTGDDAIFFAKQGHRIHTTDISDIMQNMLKEKVKLSGLENSISCEMRSFTDLGHLLNRGPYDLIFSNFAGLNCTQHLDKVLQSFSRLLKPGGLVTLVILPRFCLWESLLLFRGKFRTAFRRFSGKKGTKAHIEGEYFRCWYYNPSYVKKILGSNFTVLKVEGLCTIVPPSYMEKFGEKHPRLFQFLQKSENRLKSKWPWKMVGDYYIISLRKNG